MKKVEIYTTPTCHFCHMAKELFTTYDVPYTEYDVARDTAKRAELVDKSGQLGVPVIVIDGQDVVIGFDRERLVELLGLPA